jgi:hypothetical protein
MAPVQSKPSAGMHELAVSISWQCLEDLPMRIKNPYFARFFQNVDDLNLVAQEASLCYAPGLLNVLTAPEPPTIEWFKSCPNLNGGRDVWGVYVMVLEKEGCPFKIYIGSGTAADHRGLHNRWYQYDTGKWIPSGIRDARAEKYEITYRGCIC